MSYLQVASSFVVRDRVTDVVPEGKVPVGVPPALTAGVTSGPVLIGPM